LKLKLHLLLVHKLLKALHRLLNSLFLHKALAEDNWVTILMRGGHSRTCISLLIKDFPFICLFHKARERSRAVVFWSWFINLNKRHFFDLGNCILLLLLHLILNHCSYLKKLHYRLEFSLLPVVVVCPCISSDLLKGFSDLTH